MKKKALVVSWWHQWEWSGILGMVILRWLDSGGGIMIMINRVTISKWVAAAAASLNWHLWLKTSTACQM